MKNSRAIERADKFRQLHEKMLAKTNHNKGSEERCKDASKMLDEKLGEQWREESEVEGVAFVHMGSPEDEERRTADFDAKVDELSDDTGLPRGRKREPSREDNIDSMMARLKRILMKVL